MKGKTSNTGSDILFQDPEFETIIQRVAISVYRSLKAGMISLPFYASDQILPEIKEDIIHDIKADIILFIQDNTGDLSLRIRSTGKSSARYLKTSFINHCKDRLRTKSISTFKYFYRRVSDVLRGSGNFHTFARQANISSFSSKPGSRTVAPLTEEDMVRIPFPAGTTMLDFDFINRKNTIVELAGYFLDRLSTRFGGIPVQVDIRDFISWISLHVDIADHKNATVEYTDQTGGIENAGDDSFSHGHKYRPDRLYENRFADSETIQILAKNFSARLSYKEKLLFYLRHGKNLSLEKIAGNTGYKGPSGVKHRLDRINEKLCFFLCDLPRLSPGENGNVNEEVFSLFLNYLIKNLKSEIEKP